jgi:hypothetical protein
MGFGKINFSLVPTEYLEKLYEIEKRWRETMGDHDLHNLVHSEWSEFYNKNIEPLTGSVYYDREDLENEILIRRRDKAIDLWIENE